MRRADRGFVSIVGAGPGAVAHLTLLAAQRLREADRVLYDALVSDDVLALADGAARVYVGKRRGRAQTPQRSIHAALIAAARAGERVVRLKGGDPLVFGRGGEEALALQAAGVPYEIVPGLSTAAAAPALAGVPLTHRGVSSGVAILTGADGGACASVIDALPAASLTLVLLMSMAHRQAIGRRLQARGWPPATPAAIVVGAATAQMWTWRGALRTLGAVQVPARCADAPGTIVVGEVAGLDLRPTAVYAASVA